MALELLFGWILKPWEIDFKWSPSFPKLFFVHRIWWNMPKAFQVERLNLMIRETRSSSMDGWMSRWIDDGWIEGWMGLWLGAWMDGWIEQVLIISLRCTGYTRLSPVAGLRYSFWKPASNISGALQTCPPTILRQNKCCSKKHKVRNGTIATSNSEFQATLKTTLQQNCFASEVMLFSL